MEAHMARPEVTGRKVATEENEERKKFVSPLSRPAVEGGSLTIFEWCAKHRRSLSWFYKHRGSDMVPQTHGKPPRISAAAEAACIRAQEAKASAEKETAS
jgi:hypothetical protein